MPIINTAFYHSPVGWLELSATDKGISEISFKNSEPEPYPTGHLHSILSETIRQLEGYFTNKQTQFTIPLDLHGSDFEVEVWNQLPTIPFGQTVTYGDFSKRLNNPKAIRAIGSTIGRNPVVIIVPCHRIIGANGRMVGFGGGIWRKEWLLKHEGAILL